MGFHISGEGDGGNTDGGEGDGGQNGRIRRPPRRRNFRNGPRKPRTSENQGEGGQSEGGEGNENGQQKGGRPPRQRRFNRKPKTSGSNQVRFSTIFKCNLIQFECHIINSPFFRFYSQ